MRFFKVLLCIWLFSFAPSANAKVVPSVTVHVPMRDGLELTTDLYYPSGSIISNEYPCLLLRLPGGRKAEPWVSLAEMASEGYVVAIQDTRSAIDLEGKTVPYFSDGWDVEQDGLDTINWLASSSFTNGKIGTLGYSAAGITQILLAPTAPSALKCQYIGQAPGSLYHHAIYPGGRFQKNLAETWFGFYAPHPSVLEFVKSNQSYNDFWKKVDSHPHSHKVVTPAVHFGGWFDPFIQGTIDEFNARQLTGGAGAKGTQKLLIGPWNHHWPNDLSLGDYQVPENGKKPPLDISAKRWFEHYLKDVKNNVEATQSVTYYVMGPFDGSPSSGNVWKHADAWPIPAAVTPFYLTADRKLSRKIDGMQGSLAFIYDPEDPVPTVGGNNLFMASGPKDQRSIESRKDVLVFTTPPLEADQEVTGRVFAKVFLASMVPGVDVVMKLSDVYPDGKSLLIAEGVSSLQLSDQQKGTPQEVALDLWSTSFVFAKGHSIRISIAASNYPRYEKSLHKLSADSNDCRLLVGEKTSSCVFLPLVH